MQFTLSTNYALRALLYLMGKNSRATSVREISENIQVSQGYLLKVAGKLRQGGILDAAAGPTGGFFLARSAQEITMYDIVCAMEGEVNLCRCMEDGSQCRRCEAEACPMYRVLTQVQQALRQMLAGISLADVIDQKELVISALPELRMPGAGVLPEEGLSLAERFERLNLVFAQLPAEEREKCYRIGVVAGELVRLMIAKTENSDLRAQLIGLLDSTLMCGKLQDVGLRKAMLYADAAAGQTNAERPYPFHPVWSMDTLRSLGGADESLRSPQERNTWNTLLRAALYHHEDWDGSGYPGEVKGEGIPLIARVMHLANDIVERLQQDADQESIAAMLREYRGLRYDPALVDLLLSAG